jgi:hypothetical protein
MLPTMPTSEPEEFRVTDRRRRGDVEAEPPEPGGPAGPEAPGAQGPATAASPPAADASRPPASGRVTGPAPGDRTLIGLFVTLASSAVVALGEVPDPLTGARDRDLPQAAATIDLLVLLRERTEGNRMPEESETLDDLIYDLQLRYVAAARA